jgi:hypothetical protein
MCVLFMVIFCFEIQVLVFLHFYKKKMVPQQLSLLLKKISIIR